MIRPLPVLFGLLLLGRVAVGQERIDLPESGYRLALPDVGWAHVEQRDGSGLTTVAVGPRARGGLVQLSVKPSPAHDSRPEAVRAEIDQLIATVSADESITSIGPFEMEVAGRTAIGIQVDQSAFEQHFRVRLVLLRARGLQYRIQFHAPRDEFDAQWRIAREVIDGFELIELGADAQERRRLQELAARCGSRVDWAPDWSAAAARARTGRRLVVVAINALGGFAIGNALDERVFEDEEILALMGHRFVGMRWSAGTSAPFVRADVFGLSGTTFGTGLLVCTPDGAVVRQIFVTEAALVSDILREVLRDHAALAPPPSSPRADDDPVDRASFLLDSGQIEAARALLDAHDDADLWRARARLHRIERNGAAALAALARGEPSPRAALEAATVHLGLGDVDAATTAIDECLERNPDESCRADAGLLGGLVAWSRDDVEGARRTWNDLTLESPQQPAAWIAAAVLIGPALELGYRPDTRWPTAAESRLSRVPPAAPPGGTEPERALAAAVDWLLAAQRDDGAWDSARYGHAQYPAPDPVTMASHAIAVTALLRAADATDAPDRAARGRAAARRGLARYLEHRQLAREFPRPVAFMDYTCWGSSYGLLAVCAHLEHADADDHPIARNALRAEADRLIDDLVRIQQANGGWSYYLSQSVGGDAAVVAMSFTTATVLLALDAAQDAGLDVPTDTLQRASRCLAAMRGPNGNFEYMRMGANLQAAGAVAPEGSAARGPVCTLALQRTGQLGDDALAPSFETYVEHLAVYGNESRKALMHAGPAGQGSHYLLYDYSTAAHALRGAAVDAATRAAVRAAILRELARCHSADGSFIDNPLIGPVAGTGLAIWTLLDLQ